jgi:hypothetical protein
LKDAGANLLNDENIIILGNLDETDAGRIAKQLGEYALVENNRMIKDHGKPAQLPN